MLELSLILVLKQLFIKHVYIYIYIYRNIKQIKIKNRTYYFYNDMINPFAANVPILKHSVFSMVKGQIESS